MRSPKLAKDRANDWYRYYAGYSPGFVEDALAQLQLPGDALLLDPWNGSGTTTAVAEAHGVRALGYDANPALVVIARSRLLGAEVAESVPALVDDVLDHASLFDPDVRSSDDPLGAWLDAQAVRECRGIEHAIRHVLVEHNPPAGTSTHFLENISALAAFFYVALFDAVRSKLHTFVGSNPTWVKEAKPGESLLLPPGAVYDAFRHAAGKLTRKLRTGRPSDGLASARVDLAASSSLPLSEDSVGAVITSPPYCTRIDYVAATRPELAVLGLSKEEVRSLRGAMIGTPTIASETPSSLTDWGPAANSLLDAVAAHTSRASGTYYRKYFLQYLDAMWWSLTELRRVLSPSARAVIVVQDSFYKDVHVDLPQIIADMGQSVGLSLHERRDFTVPTTKAAINRKARTWRSSFSATESVLVLR